MTPWSRAAIVAAMAAAGCRDRTPRPVDAARRDPTALYASAGAVYGRAAYDSARVLYEQAARAAATDTLLAARALTQAGLAAWHSGAYADARRLGEEGLALKRAAGLAAEIPKSWNALALLAHNEGRFAEAIDRFDRAEQSALAIQDSVAVAKARGNRGMVYSDIGDFPRARTGIQSLLTLARATSDTQLQGNALVNLGMVEIRAGGPSQALPLLTTALRLERAAAFADGEENALGQLGTAYAAMGDPQRAIAYLDSALAIATRHGLRQQEADDLQLLAAIYDDGGDHAQALTMLARAAALADSLDLAKIRGDVARAQARAYDALGDLRSATAHADAAHAVHAKAGATLEELEDQLYLAELAQRRNDPPAAARAMAAASGLASSIDSRVARTEVALGQARLALLAGDPSGALQRLAVARRESQRVVTGHEWELPALEAEANSRLGKSDAAIAAGRAAVLAVESVRQRFAAGSMRASFAAGRSSVYSTLVVALLKRGDDAEAFRVADAARSRALLEHLAAARGVRQQGKPSTPSGALADAEQLLRRIDHLVELLRARDTSLASRRSLAAEAESGFLERELADARRDYETLMRRGAAGDRRSTALLRGDLPATAAVQRALSGGEAMLEYFVADSELVTFVVTPTLVRALRAPVAAAALAGRVRVARDVASRRDTIGPSAAAPLAGLYEVLIAPAQRAGLLAGVSTLVIVPHSMLAYLPFAALRDGRTGRYLVQEFDLVELPSGSSITELGATGGVIDGGTKASLFAPFPAELPGTKAEVEAIAAIEGGARALVARDASEAALRRALAASSIVHVATHGVLNSRSPMFTRLELAPGTGGDDPSDDGRLEVHEILDLSVRSRLVFLSGCETGRGMSWSNSFETGDDYATLAEALLYAGARNVVSTLWRIEDRGAAVFATAFYQALSRQGAARALATAQRTLIADPRYASPFYWAAYTLTGDVHQSPQRRDHPSVQ